MTILVEGNHAGAFIVSEANTNSGSGVSRSRDQIVLLTGNGKLKAGTVITKDPATSKYSPFAAGDTAGIAILYDNEDTTNSDADAVGLVRECEVNGSEIVWDAGLSSVQIADGITALNDLGIIVRASL